jgi:hypothetical protein
MIADVDRLKNDYPYIKYTLPTLRAGILALHDEIKESKKAMQTFTEITQAFTNNIASLEDKITELSAVAESNEVDLQASST